MSTTEDVKIATRVAGGIVGSILVISAAIGLPVALGNAHNASNQTARIASCVKIKNTTAALNCVQQVILGASSLTEPVVVGK